MSSATNFSELREVDFNLWYNIRSLSWATGNIQPKKTQYREFAVCLEGTVFHFWLNSQNFDKCVSCFSFLKYMCLFFNCEIKSQIQTKHTHIESEISTFDTVHLSVKLFCAWVEGLYFVIYKGRKSGTKYLKTLNISLFLRIVPISRQNHCTISERL